MFDLELVVCPVKTTQKYALNSYVTADNELLSWLISFDKCGN